MAEEPTLTVGEFFQLFGYISGTLVFIILIGIDMRNAFKKGAHWVPGHALILSALTIQVLNFIANQSSLVNEVLQSSSERDIVLNNLFMIHTTRVMLCVLVAFFLPAMARPGHEEKWAKIAALGLSVFLDIFSELSSIHNRVGESGSYLSYYIYSWPHVKQAEQVSFFVSGAIISITFIWLILLLICAAIASKSIRNITTQKIPIILAEPAENTWKGLEDHVLKSWIVTRACDPESIIARSVLASSAAMAVTICIISSVAGWISHGPIIRLLHGAESWLKLTTTILEVIFILMGWVVINWRSLSSVAYYGRWRKEDEPKKWGCWRSLSSVADYGRWRKKNEPKKMDEGKVDEPKEERWFHIEDFWTRHIVDLLEVEKLKLRKLNVDERVSKMIVTKLRKLKVDERVSKMIAKEKKRRTSFQSAFLQCVIWVQRFVVFFSKVYWLLSQITFGNLYIRKIVLIIFSKHFKKIDKDVQEYREFLTNIDHVLWDQTARDVILTNRKSIKQARVVIRKGNKDGQNCHGLIQFLKDKSSGLTFDEGILCLDPRTPHKEAGYKFLWKLHPDPALADVEKYFEYASKRSWKLMTVSLINIILRLSSPCGTACLEAYYEAWELIDLVDASDPGTDSLLSKAADRLFTTLRNEDPEPTATKTMEEADTAIKKLAENTKKDAEIIRGKIAKRKDTMDDWEKLAARIAVYKLCKSIDCRSGGDFMELLDELQSALANIIGACIKRVATALVDSSRKCAEEMEERKLLEAVYIAGKSKGLMEKLGWEPERMKHVKSDPELQIVPKGGNSVLSSNVHTVPTTEIVVQ